MNQCLCVECGVRFPVPAVGLCPNGHRQIRRLSSADLLVDALDLICEALTEERGVDRRDTAQRAREIVGQVKAELRAAG